MKWDDMSRIMSFIEKIHYAGLIADDESITDGYMNEYENDIVGLD